MDGGSVDVRRSGFVLDLSRCSLRRVYPAYDIGAGSGIGLLPRKENSMNTAAKGRRLLNKTVAKLKEMGALAVFPAKGLHRGATHGEGIHQVDLIAFFEDHVAWVESTDKNHRSRARKYLQALPVFPVIYVLRFMVFAWEEKNPHPLIEIVHVKLPSISGRDWSNANADGSNDARLPDVPEGREAQPSEPRRTDG
jgi:hypothetical protein